VQGRDLPQEIGQDCTFWPLSRGKNTGRSNEPRVRRALSSPEHARARPLVPRFAPNGQPTPWPAPAPIKTPRHRPHSSPHAQTSPELNSPPFARVRRVRGHPSHYRRRPASPALPNPVQPSETSVHAPVKLPEQGIGVCFTGEASPRSPECVDRVIH
jgi:hypothetical protein